MEGTVLHRRHWIIAPLTAVMVLLGLTFGVGPAAAATGSGTGQACKYDYLTYNACLNIYQAAGSNYGFSVIVGIDLHLPGGYPQQALRRGSSLRATLYTTAETIVLPVRSGWPQAGPYVLSAQFGFDDIGLHYVPGENTYQGEIVFTEVHAGGYTTTRTYKTGIIYDTIPSPPPHCPEFCS